MGQIFSLLRNLAQICRCSSEQQDIESICMEVITDLKVTDRQIEDLAQVVVSKHMETIAIKYLGLTQVTVDNLRRDRQGDSTAFNRDLLVLWRNKNPGINQSKVSRKESSRFVHKLDL